MSRKINSILYTSRPPASARGARIAWDLFEWSEKDKGTDRKIVGMWYAFMDYWVWVAEFEDGEFDEIDGLVISDRLNNPQKYST